MIKFFIKYLEKRGYSVFKNTAKKGIYLSQAGEKYKIFRTTK